MKMNSLQLHFLENYSSTSFNTYYNHIKASRALLDKDRSDEEIALAISNIQMSKQALALGDALTLASSESTYQTYVAKNAIDGDPATFLWTSSEQSIGDYFILRNPLIYIPLQLPKGIRRE